jgi:hypothetical protein
VPSRTFCHRPAARSTIIPDKLLKNETESLLIINFFNKLMLTTILVLFSTFLMSNLSIANDSKSGKYLTDQKDMNNDFQIHFIYLACKGKKDNEWDLNGEMEAEILKMNKKFYKMTGEKQKFKLDYRVDGKLDIPFARLDRKCRGGGWNNNYPGYYLQKMGFNNPKKLYYTYADYNNGGNSGMMGVHHGYTMLSGTSEKDRIGLTIHELLHVNGFSWACTKGHFRGHVRGRSILSNSNYDYNKLGNMIYNHKDKSCPDLKDSVYLTPTSKDPYDPLQLGCHLANRSGKNRETPGKTFKWPKKYDHKKFKKIKKGEFWCTYDFANYAKESWFRKWKE